jgi:hypothetical protein
MGGSFFLLSKAWIMIRSFCLEYTPFDFHFNIFARMAPAASFEYTGNMEKARAILVLSVVVAFMPFTGFPGSWKTALYAGLGTVIFILAFLVHRDLLQSRRKVRRTDVGDPAVYVESRGKKPRKKIIVS